MNSLETNFPIKSVTLRWLCQREALDTMRMNLGWGEWCLAIQCSFSLLPTHTFSLRNDCYCSFLKPELLHWVLFSLYRFHLHSAVGVEYWAQHCVAKYCSTLHRVAWAERSPLRWIPNALAVGNVFLLISLSVFVPLLWHLSGLSWGNNFLPFGLLYQVVVEQWLTIFWDLLPPNVFSYT